MAGLITSVLGDITSGVGSILSPILPTVTIGPGRPTTTLSTSSLVLTTPILPSPSISVSLTPSLSILSSSTPSTTSTTSSSTPPLETTPSTTITPTTTPTRTVTEFQSETAAAAAASTSAASNNPSGFLQNKAAMGAVFGLAGLIGLVLIILGTTYFIRRRRNNKLLDEAVSFDPTPTHGLYSDDVEKNRGSLGSVSGGSGSHLAQAPYPVPPHHSYEHDPRYGYGNQQGYQTYALPSQLANQAYDGVQTDHYNTSGYNANGGYGGNNVAAGRSY